MGARPPAGDNSATHQPAQWHDDFVMVGGGVALLTGLVFVAMSLHLDQLGTMAAFIFMVSGAWLLMVGVARQDATAEAAAS